MASGDELLSALGAPAGPSIPLSSVGQSLSAGEALPVLPAASTFASLMQGGDAQAELVRGVLQHQLVLTSRSTKAIAFLYAYGLGEFAVVVLKLREYHQNPKRLTEALESISLKKYLEGISVNVSNSK